ncbi:hypothetical protein MTO96_029736 [Rhipicephalus appendiculatus]
MSWPCCFICALVVLHAAVITRCEDQYTCDSDALLPSKLVREIRSYQPTVDKIIDTVVHGDEQNVTYDELAKFVDTFGPRPSGSKSLEDSIDYMFDMLRGQGLDFVHTENASVVNWQRGHEEAWMGGITAPVLVVGCFEELEENSKKAKGKIVVFNQEFVTYSKTIKYRVQGASAAAKAGAVAALVRSLTPMSINSPHTGYMTYDANTTRIPTAAITIEDAELLARLQERGSEPVVKLVVLLSGHLDSWDVGQGALDDGAGAFISWRALAVLRRLGLRPRRTLRSVLWTGEELHTAGALEYFRRHFASEQHLMNLVMESDSGTFRPLGLSFSGSNERARCIVAEFGSGATRTHALNFSCSLQLNSHFRWAQCGLTFFICAVLVLDAAVVTQSQNQYRCHGNTALPRRLVREIRSYKPIVEKIIDMVVYGAEQNVTYDELAMFVDRFGARPSGSKTLEDSIDYMVDILPWARQQGGITAPVLVVKSFEELKRNARKAKGKIVVFNQAFVSYDKTVKYREHGATEAAKAGAVAALVRSVTPFSINSPHTGVMEYGKNTPRIPTASITLEDAELLARWQDRGIKPVIKLVMGAKRLPPGVSRNTIAEIRGRTKPKEVVAVSGHIDSWDVGQGAMDDGAGAFIAWRALAVLRRLGLRPRRTLRSILFTGEEQGITGAMDYFERHFPHERNLLNVVMESDSGTFRPLGLAFSGSNKRARCIVAEVLSLFASINATLLTLGVLEPDLEPWIKQGVPALALNTADERYFYFHHTEADTMSVLDRHELDLCTALWAAASYIFADLSIRLPR